MGVASLFDATASSPDESQLLADFLDDLQLYPWAILADVAYERAFEVLH